MQLNRQLRDALTAATCTLLGAPAAQADWSFDSALLIYSETDRVTALEPIIAARWDLGDEQWMNFKFTFDSLTGSSANGAVPAATVQTFTNPSGGGQYRIQPGGTPLDPTFKDTRTAFNYAWEIPLASTLRLDLGANISVEFDYAAVSFSTSLAKDFNLKNTTVAVGMSLGQDSISPVGGTPVPYDSMSLPWREGEDDDDGGGPPPPPLATPPARLGDQSKDLVDVLFGVTQVLSPHSLIQLNYSFGSTEGYLTDPYKYMSVVDGVAGPNQGNPLDYIYENRPDSRTKQALYAAYKHRTEGDDTWDASYRYMWDDWGIKSHTLEGHYRWRLGAHDYLQPHLRWYQQSAADFYRPFLLAAAPLPAAASADYRLGDMTTSTLGLKWGHAFSRDVEIGMHVEYYRQSGDPHPATAIGVLRQYDLFPVVDALMLQVDFSF